MLYQIAEHTAERLAVRRYWDGRGEGMHMLVSGIVMLIAGPVFCYHSFMNGVPIGVPLLFGGAALVGLFMIWLSRRQRKRVEEGLYVFDKRRAVFELSHRNERGVTKAEVYPLDLVKAAVAEDIGSEGYARRLVILLRDNRSAALHNWTTFIHGDAERASQTINEFLGSGTSLAERHT
jgi:hypothetical protein